MSVGRMRLRHGIAAVFAAALGGLLLPCSARMAKAAPPSPAGQGVQEAHLPDGLTVLLKEVHSAPVVCTYVWYRVGSRNETPGLTGISHQLEHMMFKGTKKLYTKPGYIDLLIGRHGGENNAETDTDYTAYHFLLPSDQIDLALRIEADRMTDAAIDPKQLAAENTVVLSELEGDENDNSYFLSENARATAFQYHPYHYPVIGTKWDVKHFTRAQVYDYYRAHYGPNNATLVVVGDFNSAALMAKIRDLWRPVQPISIAHHTIDPEPPQEGERRITVRRAGSSPYLQLEYHIPNALSVDIPALDVLSTALSGGRSSRLYRALVDAQLATDVGASPNLGIDPELFDISATIRDTVQPDAVEKALLAEIDRVRTAPLSEFELQKAKNQTLAGFIFAQENVESQADRLGFYETITGDWRNLGRYPAEVKAVTLADVQRVAAKYFTADNRTVATFIPNGETPGPATGGAGGTHGAHYRATSKPEIRSAGDFGAAPMESGKSAGVAPRDASKVAVRKLANGMTVIVCENHANPTVTIGGFTRAGSVDDPPGKFGVASITAEMLSRGTKTRTAQQIADETDFVGASLGASASRERSDFGGLMLKQDFEPMVALFADMLRNPTFPAAELEKVRGEALSAIAESRQDTASVATRSFYESLYATDTAFAHEPIGNETDVAAISTEDVLRYYQAAYRPDRITLVFVGDVRAEEVFATANKLFHDWTPRGDAPPVRATPAPVVASVAPAPIQVTLPDKSQDDVIMGLVGISRKSPDYEPAILMNLILGGDEFVGRVGKRVRDTEGLAYYAYTGFSPGLEAGPWVFRAGVNPANVLRAVASARDEIKSVVASGVTASDLEWAKDHLIGAASLALATNGGIASELENSEFYGLGTDYADRFPAIIRAVTLARVNACARKYLLLDRMALVVAGPAVPGLKAVSH